MANSVTLDGVVGRPQVREAKSGTVVFTFSLGFYNGKKDGEKSTGWLECVVFGDMAGHAADSFEKGARVVVTGRLAQDEWEDKEGGTRTKLKLLVDAIGGDVRFNPVEAIRDGRPEVVDDDEDDF